MTAKVHRGSGGVKLPSLSPTAGNPPGIRAGSRGRELGVRRPYKCQGFWGRTAGGITKPEVRECSCPGWLLPLFPCVSRGNESLRAKGAGGNLFPHSHRDGASRSNLGKADNSCEDKDTRDCCLINSGGEEYQTLALIHPLAEDIVFLSLR